MAAEKRTHSAGRELRPAQCKGCVDGYITHHRDYGEDADGFLHSEETTSEPCPDPACARKRVAYVERAQLAPISHE